MDMPNRGVAPGAALLAIFSCFIFNPQAFAEGPSRFEKERARMMLKILRQDLVKYYYDPSYHGLSLDEAFGQASNRIDAAQSLSQILAAVSMPLLDLNDSHTYFIPPERSARFHFGWRMQAIGDRCYVTNVQEGSDAEAKGVRKGDRVLTVNDRELSRDNLWDLIYAHRVLAPRATLPMVVQSPGEEPRRVDVAARVEERKVIVRRDSPFDLGDYRREMENEAYLSRHRFKEVSEDLLIWKMPEFNLTGDEVRTLMNRMRKYKCLILDLRGNPGGAIETLERMVGCFVAHKTKIGDLKSRDPMPPIIARKTGDLYAGMVVVLVDSGSASASELFARVMQIAGRARVLGDRTAGAVMMSRSFDHSIGASSGITFASSITIADIIMPDGTSLEHSGVVPDEILLPASEDLAAGRDPVMSRAISLCGATIDPATAGGYFPFEWKR